MLKKKTCTLIKLNYNYGKKKKKKKRLILLIRSYYVDYEYQLLNMHNEGYLYF